MMNKNMLVNYNCASSASQAFFLWYMPKCSLFFKLILMPDSVEYDLYRIDNYVPVYWIDGKTICWSNPKAVINSGMHKLMLF